MDQDNNNIEMNLDSTPDDSGSRVTFDDEQRHTRLYTSQTSTMSQWLMKYSGGYVKNEKQASYVMMVFVILAVSFSIYLLFDSRGNMQDNAFAPAAEAPLSEVVPPAEF